MREEKIIQGIREELMIIEHNTKIIVLYLIILIVVAYLATVLFGGSKILGYTIFLVGVFLLIISMTIKHKEVQP